MPPFQNLPGDTSINNYKSTCVTLPASSTFNKFNRLAGGHCFYYQNLNNQKTCDNGLRPIQFHHFSSSQFRWRTGSNELWSRRLLPNFRYSFLRWRFGTWLQHKCSVQRPRVLFGGDNIWGTIAGVDERMSKLRTLFAAPIVEFNNAVFTWPIPK